MHRKIAVSSKLREDGVLLPVADVTDTIPYFMTIWYQEEMCNALEERYKILRPWYVRNLDDVEKIISTLLNGGQLAGNVSDYFEGDRSRR